MSPPKLPPRVRIKNGAYHFTYDTEEIYPDGKPKQKSVKLCRVDEGEKRLYERLAEERGDKQSATGNLPDRLQKFMQIYLPTLSHASRIERERVYKMINEAFADFDTEQVRAPHVDDFVRANFDTPRMQNEAKSRMSHFMDWCAGRGYADSNPCQYVKIKQLPAKRFEWTADKWHAIRKALLVDVYGRDTPSGPMMQCYMDLCYLLYQRNTEERLLRLTQIDRSAGVIRFIPKKTEKSTGANVSVPITPAIAAVLDRAAEIRKSYGNSVIAGYVICKRDGTPYSAAGIRAAWDRACKRTGIDGLTSKSIRGYAATEANRQGFTKDQIQKGLAHRLITTTEGYVAKHQEQYSVLTLALPDVPDQKMTLIKPQK